MGVLEPAVACPEVELALEAVLAQRAVPVTHLCCGSAGHIELLLEAARRLGRPDLRREAARRASALVRDARLRGRWEVSPAMPAAVSSPTFYQGLAGIGYTLLRVADPMRFPSVALFD
jgi:lantibiotic modifying enzyme